jgi:hypothetical protein
MARVSIQDETAVACVSTSGGAPDTLTVSLAPATLSLNGKSMRPPTATCSLGVIWADMFGAVARAE